MGNDKTNKSDSKNVTWGKEMRVKGKWAPTTP